MSQIWLRMTSFQPSHFSQLLELTLNLLYLCVPKSLLAELERVRLVHLEDSPQRSDCQEVLLVQEINIFWRLLFV